MRGQRRQLRQVEFANNITSSQKVMDDITSGTHERARGAGAAPRPIGRAVPSEAVRSAYNAAETGARGYFPLSNRISVPTGPHTRTREGSTVTEVLLQSPAI